MKGNIYIHFLPRKGGHAIVVEGGINLGNPWAAALLKLDRDAVGFWGDIRERGVNALDYEYSSVWIPAACGVARLYRRCEDMLALDRFLRRIFGWFSRDGKSDKRHDKQKHEKLANMLAPFEPARGNGVERPVECDVGIGFDGVKAFDQKARQVSGIPDTGIERGGSRCDADSSANPCDFQQQGGNAGK
jgi:hypothetical protein